MPSGPVVILTLKLLVTAVTLLLLAALIALAIGEKRWHGRMNVVFFVLTMLTVLGFEGLLRLGLDATSDFSEEARQALRVHLLFAVPSALILPAMLWTGLTGRRRWHLPLAVVFLLLWGGTVVTGIVFLPHS